MTWIPMPRLNPAPVIKRRGRRIISFRKKDDRFGWMGNMPHFEVEHQSVKYKSSEHLFQSLRYKGHPRIQRQIRGHPNSLYMKKTVHRRSVHLIAPLDPKQDKERMLVCLRAKVAAHPWMAKRLVATGNAMIIENVSRRPRGSGKVWGAAWDRRRKEWQGHNWLGRLWMKLRAELCRSVRIRANDAARRRFTKKGPYA